MKQIFTLLLVAMTSLTYAQSDSTRQDTLREVQVVGVTTTSQQPITQTRFNTTEYGFLNVQKDPFYILDKATPSIYAQSDNGQGNGYSYMRLRGLDQTRINFNLNGIPLNEMEDEGLYFSNMPGFYNYLSNITVERGVGTSKYGTTSIAGSVDMETRSMSDTGLEVTTLLKSTYPGYFANLFYSSGINKNGFAFQVGGNYQANDGFKYHSGNDGGSVFYSLGWFKKHNIFKVYGFSGLIHNHLAFYGVPMAQIDSDYRTNLNATTDRDTFNQNMVSLNWVNYSYEHTKFNTSLYFENVNGAYNTAGCLFGVNSYQYGLMSNMVIERKHLITNVGFNTNIYTRYHFGYDNNGYYDYPQNCQRYYNVGHKEDVIAYIKGTYLAGKTNLFYDVQGRDVWYNATYSKTYNWLFLNPKVGIKNTNGNHNFYATFGITQREPTRTDMIQNVIQSDSSNRYGNTDNTKFLANDTVNLHPELVYDFEVGDCYHTDAIDARINGYVMRINHEYVATGVIDPYSGFMVKQVVDYTLREGIEASIKVKVNKFLIFFNAQVQANSLYVHNQPTTSIPFTPNMIMSGGIAYNTKHITAGVNTQMVASMIMSLNQESYTSTPYDITNCFVDYKVKHFTLSLNVGNIFNSKYYLPAGVMGVPTYYVGNLINYMLTLKMKL